jgi:hypothetical protein
MLGLNLLHSCAQMIVGIEVPVVVFRMAFSDNDQSFSLVHLRRISRSDGDGGGLTI